jgi:NitT/TauT family transport system substrate-binding protein
MVIRSVKQWAGKILVGIVFGGLALAVGSGVVSAKEQVNVSIFSWPGYAFLFIAKEKNLAPDLDINVEIIEDPMQSFSLIVSGDLDATLSTAEFGPIATETGMPLKVVGLTNFNCGMDKIIVHPDIKDPSELRGEKIAVMEGGLSQLFAAIYLERQGISPDEVEFVNLIMDDAAAAMLGGDVAAGEFWAPYSYLVLENLEGSWVGADAGDEFWMNTALLSDAIFFSDDLINNRRDAAVALMKAYYDGKEWWRANPTEGNQIIADALQFSVEDVEGVLGATGEACVPGVGAYYAPFIVSARFCGAAPGDPGHHMDNGGIYDQWRLTNEWWIKLGLMEKEIPPARGVDCSISRELYEMGYAGEPAPHY